MSDESEHPVGTFRKNANTWTERDGNTSFLPQSWPSVRLYLPHEASPNHRQTPYRSSHRTLAGELASTRTKAEEDTHERYPNKRERSTDLRAVIVSVS